MPRSVTPLDWLSGSKTPKGKYTAWDSFGQGLPDFGKGAGPGEPYRKVTKTVPMSAPPKWAPSSPTKGSGTPSGVQASDPRTEAIRRRLRGL
jgi:hypothetical protein